MQTNHIKKKEITNKTQKIIHSNSILATKEDSEQFFNALLNPPAPNEKLINAFMDYKKKLKP